MELIKKCLWSNLPIYLLVIALFAVMATVTTKTVTAVAEALPMPRSHTIVIDAGHGGEDGGAVSCTGVQESQINLEISLRLRDLLHFLGYQTKMIRTSNTSVSTQGSTISQRKVSDLKHRVQMVEETENALLISIHQNQFSEKQYAGAQVFYAPTQGSQELAEETQAQLIALLNPASKRACKKADSVYLMQHISCTGILVECGFLSNPEEEAKLRTPEYQQMLCCILASSLDCFLTQNGNMV